ILDMKELLANMGEQRTVTRAQLLLEDNHLRIAA
ncbi:MAG: hypothetical protein JWN23_1472, partial [Rhodocyclales bacterium]|nr:hypothetical protein [Rhodocyclales bacterium]